MDTIKENEKFEKKLQKSKRKGRQPVLARYVDYRFHIRFRYRDKFYIAHVRRDGSITFARESAESKRLQGKAFMSPSSAASAVTKRAMNGWVTWTYETRTRRLGSIG